jgi:hypothetical protein
MLRDLRISGFRGFREFAMSGLGRVNLLVGMNNCGKTSVLEAVHMLSAPGSATPLWQAQARRAEFVDNTAVRRAAVAHLIHGHRLAEGSGFTIAGDGTSGRQTLIASFVPGKPALLDVELDADDDEDDEPDGAEPTLGWLRLDWQADSFSAHTELPIAMRGALRDPRTIPNRVVAKPETRTPVSFLTSKGQTRDSIVSMFERVVLTPDEATVLRALHTIEPAIERIASTGTQSRRSSRDAPGLAIMVAGQRIPIGSMGDGIWRLLGIALTLVRARGGVLLVDEIDTGLHYSVLVDVWRLVLETARNLDVQVFATTHSRDCYEALAAVTEPGRTEISLQRIERGKVEAVAFTELEIRQAAERGLEVR